MIYIITEDKNSARDFWEIAAKNHVGDSNYKMVPLVNESAGNTTLDAQVQSIIGKLNSGDILFIAFDNIVIHQHLIQLISLERLKQNAMN